MATLTIPENVLNLAKRQAKNHGYSTVSEYVQHLIQEDNDPLPVISTREELNALLIEALDDPEPAKPYSKEYFDDLKKEIIAKGKS